jgi:CRP/FNR family transcriptional activator FtrB
MKNAETQEIRSLPMFQNMKQRNLTALLRGAYCQTFPPSIDLISEGDASDFLHIVVEGSVELFARWDARETTIDTVEPVQTFVLAATIRDAPYLMSARTLEKTRLVLLPSEDVRAAFDSDDAFALAAIYELAGRYRALVKTTKNLKLRRSVERLANYLLRKYHQSGDQEEFELSVEKRRLASYLGMSPENLSRSFRALESHGVKVRGPLVQIVDADALTRFSRPTDLIDRTTP